MFYCVCVRSRSMVVFWHVESEPGVGRGNLAEIGVGVGFDTFSWSIFQTTSYWTMIYFLSFVLVNSSKKKSWFFPFHKWHTFVLGWGRGYMIQCQRLSEGWKKNNAVYYYVHHLYLILKNAAPSLKIINTRLKRHSFRPLKGRM